MEITTCARAIYIVEAEFCVGDGLAVDACHIELEEKVFDGAIVQFETNSGK